jgi:hypothetical protein
MSQLEVKVFVKELTTDEPYLYRFSEAKNSILQALL